MRFTIVIVLLLISNIPTLIAQDKINFGKLTETEKTFKTYKKDTTAHAVVLYEWGNNYFELIKNQYRIIKEYHVKIKVLDEKGYNQSEISIPFYHKKSSSENVNKIMANTHNGNTIYNVLPSHFHKNDLSENWSEIVFTFPKVQKGSILEYYYKITSPFIYNFNGWEFQSSIPKLYSEFNASIPGLYHYNRNLNGTLELTSNKASIRKKCLKFERSIYMAECEVLKYVMKDIPAFKEEEEYMLAASNYMSRLDFELSDLLRFDGTIETYTKSWKSVDKEFRTDQNIGRQLTKKNFFQKNVPENLFSEGNELERAKNIYDFIRNHYTWNKKFGIFGNARVKEAFENKVGNVAELNMSLINLLNAAGIETKLMLSSTRKNGLPKMSHPVMSDFNYFIAHATIDGTEYLLDATDKYLPFGMLPFRALNHYGRVLDFNNESYWHDIIPRQSNRYQIRGQVNFDIDNHKANGVLDITSIGYNAVDLRKVINQLNEEEYVEKFESAIQGDFNITSYELVEERSNQEKVSERFKFEIENVVNGNIIYLNPFFIRFFDQNPFTLEERNYPIDFGYPRNYKYQINISIPDGYAVHELPENQIVNLGDKMATLKFYHRQAQNQISISFDLVLNTNHFPAKDYEAIKQLFKHVTNVQKNTLVVLKKE